MEKKTRLRLVIAALLGAAALGAALGLAAARYKRSLAGSGSRDTALENLERSADEAGSSVGKAIEGARGAARDLDQRERETLAGYSELAENARNLAGGLDNIGANSQRAREYLDELESLIEELQRRSKEEHP